ncbi:MAG: SRPBCC domain-containing protein, partial [Ramlibacter sp.]
GQGGAAGFGKGSARVRLSPAAAGDGCELSYSVQAQVGGKIAQVGQRLIDGVARSMADDFFKRFDEELQRRYPPAAAPVADTPAAPPAPAALGRSIPWWTITAIVFVLIGLWWASR